MGSEKRAFYNTGLSQSGLCSFTYNSGGGAAAAVVVRMLLVCEYVVHLCKFFCNKAETATQWSVNSHDNVSKSKARHLAKSMSASQNVNELSRSCNLLLFAQKSLSLSLQKMLVIPKHRK